MHRVMSEKESAVLEAMCGHPLFMQGVAVPDTVGNLVRILDFIPGQSLYEFLRRILICLTGSITETYSPE